MIYAPPSASTAPVTTKVIVTDTAGEPNDAICPDGYTLTSLKYKDSSGKYADANVWQPNTGTCLSQTTSDQNVYGQNVWNPVCPSGTTQIGGYNCDEACNSLWGGPAGGYCGGTWGFGCRYLVCRTTTCTKYEGAWVKSSSVLPKGANSSVSSMYNFREAVCTDYRPVWQRSK
jgi:hypothetical protein